MAFDKKPSSFFGPGFSVSAGALIFSNRDNLSLTVGSTFSTLDTTFLEFASPHGLKVGDIIRFTQVTTLDANLSEGVDYYVKYVSTTARINISLLRNGAAVVLANDGTADNTCQLLGPLAEVTDDEADPTSGDWRRVAYGFATMLSQSFSAIPKADRPANASVSSTSGMDDATGLITKYITLKFIIEPTGFEVKDE